MEYISLLVVAIVTIILYYWYASIIKNKNKVLESLAGIDVQLEKRNDLIPNILKIAAKFMEHEKELMQKLTELRTKFNNNYNKNDIESVKQHLQDAKSLDQGLSQFMISVENYPNLKSNESMVQAQKTYNEIEEQIAAARRFYNSSVANLNNSIQIFPGGILANFAQAKQMPFYQIDESKKISIDADSILR